ncbi:tectonic-3-like isoform X1 [Chiloscyllium plagiosum]|uniref:tectonic-3-like isoform X1 n=1 Tax=Chiloscyllium plagiosum TaxID=36176 RepID=UPI001CB7CB52|nr:tectonic-3-like isoform X1 [Chiloscyllium plagiosum]
MEARLGTLGPRALCWALVVGMLMWTSSPLTGEGLGPGSAAGVGLVGPVDVTSPLPGPRSGSSGNPDPVRVGGESVTPDLVRVGGESVTPDLVRVGRDSVIPDPARVGGDNVTPDPVIIPGESVTPDPESVTPDPISAGGDSVTPDPAVAGGGSVTPDPTVTRGGSVTPDRPGSQGASVTPEPNLWSSHSVNPGDESSKCLTTAVPICICDLIEGLCEIGCCCDLDCSNEDVGAFSSCLPGSEPVINKVCVESSVMFTSNSPFPAGFIEDGPDALFCVFVNNPKTNFYVTPQHIDRESFPLLVSQFGRGSFIRPLERQSSKWPETLSKASYQVGDQIKVFLLESFSLGILRQPTALTGGECTDRNPVGFLQDRSTTCTRSVRNLTDSCDMLASLNAVKYYEKMYLLSTPNITFVESWMNEVNGTKQQLWNKKANHTVQISVGNESVLPPWVSNNMCKNVVSEVTYHIMHDGNEGIVGAKAAFRFTNVSFSVSKIQQRFNVFFLRMTESIPAKRRSGNPGYLKGKPILAFNGEEAASLTILKSSSDGSCSQFFRSDILFQHNMRADCLHSFESGSTCSDRQTDINSLLLGNDPPDSLGILGNASGRNPESLTKIISPVPEALNVNCQSSCTLATALEIQILWANVGPLANPQAAVLGARFHYQKQDVQCSSSRVTLKTFVTFVDTTRYPPAPRDQPTIEQKLPFDFFYPFKVYSSGMRMYSASILGTVGSVFLTGFLAQR